MSTFDDVKKLLADALQLGDRADHFDLSTPLLGSVPELDSMAVVNVITTMEERFGITVEDDEINADTFATMASLVEFVEQKLSS